ncbi:hypothetical protein Desca_0831 [Desulfotomaculum nigrificans CO-1-SRB]|uniref:Uncharacterized protein n=1 Tax=Desulfotomaculum nigrificans (strain DSM 14880 / VKM B-2319 / CO-1-SRB) TaxID=868595 RepID=F6B9D5_DESCC|nr:hypothetical protein [Desulfotomaculum nigrificans]AEF93711.1 hypothetical protein Desca_0831 [Desulfotomaculum nigrificans CO-1-SRB]
MVRFKCIKCGKIVEYLRIFKEIPKEPKCSCGGDLQLINNSSNEINKGGFTYENRNASEKRIR